jgi:hypothetical protein
MAIIIDPPVWALSPRKEIEAWIRRLKEMKAEARYPEDAETIQGSLERAEEMLEDNKALRP